jgi:small-conductance mechanosensitive channel
VQLSILLIGLEWALVDALQPAFQDRIRAALATLLLLVWLRFALQAGNIIFRHLASDASGHPWVKPIMVPLLQFGYKVMLLGLGSYLLMSTWRVNLASWLTSAGVVGIAIGFAAKDTLANFIAGIFILVDAPYKVGDMIIIDETTRGQVTEIGMRSTRLLTRDNVEVTVPNAVIGNAKIVNESSGPTLHMRVQSKVGVAYGSDVDEVKRVLTEAVTGLAHVTAGTPPVVRFEAMGESSLDFIVMVMAEHPIYQRLVRDEMNTRIYKALQEAAIAIPFPQRDLHVKSWHAPAGPAS